MFRTFVFVAAFIVVVARSAFAQPPASATPAVPLDAVAAIADAFKSHSLVALGETHGHRERQDFLLRLVADARFAAVANDIVVEGGSSSYQPLVDRFVSGEDVPPESLRRAWRDTPGNGVDMFQLVRAINSTRPKARHLRVLLGEPPIDADRADKDFDRNRFAARLIEREVLARRRRALLTYGSGHFVRKAAYSSLVTLLERGAGVKIFSVWTSVTDLRRIDADLEPWAVPSLALVRDTPLGLANFAAYVPSTVFIIPREWQVPMQDQFDAVLHLGETATWTFQAPGNAGAK